MSGASKCFFQSVAQSLGQMFRRRSYRKLMVIASLAFHNASQRIVLRRPFRFVPQQLFNLFMVRDKESSI